MDSRKPLTAGEIEALKRISADYDKHGVEWKEAMFVLEALPRLLSLLPPPPDAAVPEFASFVALADKAADNAFEVIAQLRAHISDLTRRLAEAEAERDNAAYLLMRAAPLTIKANARAEVAEARVRELEDFKTRVMAWARGRCGACEHEGSEDDTCNNCQSDYEQSNWTPPKAWEVGE